MREISGSKLVIPYLAVMVIVSGTLGFRLTLNPELAPSSIPSYAALILIIAGAWSALNAILWNRTTTRYRSYWRPPYRITTVILAVGFLGAGAWLFAHPELMAPGNDAIPQFEQQSSK